MGLGLGATEGLKLWLPHLNTWLVLVFSWNLLTIRKTLKEITVFKLKLTYLTIWSVPLMISPEKTLRILCDSHLYAY